MGKVAVIKIRSDESGQGFLASLQVCQDDGLPLSEIEGAKLPSHPDIEASYLMWQTFFRGLKSRGNDGWEVEPTFIQRSTIEGVDACRQWVKSLESNLQNWLQESSDRKWQQIREKLVGELAKNSPDIRVMIKADASLWKLPWHSWDLFNSYPDLGISFSPEDYEKEEIVSQQGNDKLVKILAVFGDDDQIDLQPDRLTINNLKDAKTEVLNQPTALDFIKKVRQESGWDILFFAGHSETKERVGKIYISKDECLEIEQFKNALKSAINQGLKIAIFNSCEGLGLVEEIAKLQIPIAIFMQEKVPDRVAQSFLKEFLTEYANGQPLHTAFRRAQSRLEEFTTLPGATWLPKLYQNLGETPPTWEELRDKHKPNPLPIPPPREKLKFKTVLIASSIVTSLVMGVRSLGWLQSWELQTLDRLMLLRPEVKPDPRILIITVTEEDIQAQKQKSRTSLSDEALAKLLNKLTLFQPRAIGFDIFRDFPVEPAYKNLANQIRNNDRFIAICKGSELNKPGVSPPPEVPAERLGFNDVVTDPGRIPRRLLLIMNNKPLCETKYALSLQLALRYLQPEGIKLEFNSKGYLKLNKVIFTPMDIPWGGYQQFDNKGHQILLNYRPAKEVANKFSLGEFMSDRINPNLFKGRIVLIGTDAESVRDTFFTPYGELPGVVLHAYITSQILSAVLDEQPLLWVFPQWGEAILILFWSFIGGIITWQFPLLIRLEVAIVIAVVILLGVCFLVFWLAGGWLPLIPSGLGLLITSGSLFFQLQKVKIGVTSYE